MEEVTLYEYDTPSLYILLKVYFNEKDHLVFEGLDCGPRVKDLMGDYDYEYTFTIKPDQLDKLYIALAVNSKDKHDLLQAIKQRFSNNEAYSKFGEFLSECDIKFSAFSWV